MAVTIDLGAARELHPRDKQPVGERLARQALARVYGLEVAYRGPVFESLAREGSALALTFTAHEGELVDTNGGELEGFWIAGDERVFLPARASIEENVVRLSSPEVAEPVAARYAFAGLPACDLFDGAGLPAAPFRTDDWDDVVPPVSTRGPVEAAAPLER